MTASVARPQRGDRVAFTVPTDHETRAGARVEGNVERRMRDGSIVVVEMTGMTRISADPAKGVLRGFNIEETRWTVPKSITVEIIRKAVRYGNAR